MEKYVRHCTMLSFLILVLGAVAVQASDVFEHFSFGLGGFQAYDNWSAKDGKLHYEHPDPEEDWIAFNWWKASSLSDSGDASEERSHFLDFSVSVETSYETGPKNIAYGVVVCYDKFYDDRRLVLLIHGPDPPELGYYKIVKYSGGDSEALTQWTPSSLIKGENDILQITKDGDSYEFFINSQTVKSMTIRGLDGGLVGVTCPHEVRASFDNFLLVDTTNPGPMGQATFNSTTKVLHIPSVNVINDYYWVNLRAVPSDTILFELDDFGTIED